MILTTCMGSWTLQQAVQTMNPRGPEEARPPAPMVMGQRQMGTGGVTLVAGPGSSGAALDEEVCATAVLESMGVTDYEPRAPALLAEYMRRE